MNNFFNIKDHSFSLAFFFIIVKKSQKQIDYKKLLKTQTSLNPIWKKIFFKIRDYSFPLQL